MLICIGKVYGKQEEEKRRLIFLERHADIELHNYKASIGEESYRRGLNEFSDMVRFCIKLQFYVKMN